MKRTICIILAAVLLGGVVGYAAARHPFVDVPEGRDMTATFWTLLEETP